MRAKPVFGRLLAVLSLSLPVLAHSLDLNMCMDPRFATRAELSGYKKLMYDAAQRVGYTIKITPVLWDECQEGVQSGKFDGAIPSSYNDERAGYMYYPADAASNPNSSWAVAKLDYVVVTAANSNYNYDGNAKSLPQPAMVPSGHEVLVGRLLKLNPTMKVLDIESNDKRNLGRLLRGEKGAVVMIKDYADVLMQRPMYKENLHVSERPIFTVTYFMPFSKMKTTVSKDEIQRVWDSISTLRRDPKWVAANMPKDDD